jgi:cytochrome o ubiquinol oxidase subunit 2
MNKARRPLFFMLFFSGVFLLLILILQPLQVLHFRNYIAILFPKGIIGVKELDLLIVLQVLMLFIVIPVYIFTFIFSWKYSVYNPKHKYDPDLVDHKLAEYVWWGVPLVLTLIASTLTIIKSYQLDPYKPIASDKPPLTIQVVALQWKWLFIYPEEKVASVNFFQIPKDVPIHFQITSDAPMNSFWIPQLGGQIYAMPNMQTELHLMANQTGDFRGASANISGEGFAGMHFIARASDEDGFKKWIDAAQASAAPLDFAGYQVLAKPSQNNPVETYQLKDSKLFHKIMMKYRHE